VRTVEGEVGEWLVLLGPAIPPLKDTLRLFRSRPDMRLASHLLSCACLSTGSFSNSAAVGRLSASLFRHAVTMLSSACAHILITTMALHLPGIGVYRQQLPNLALHAVVQQKNGRGKDRVSLVGASEISHCGNLRS
jgi:hypothetical protein